MYAPSISWRTVGRELMGSAFLDDAMLLAVVVAALAEPTPLAEAGLAAAGAAGAVQRGTTVLGHYPAYLNMAKSLRARVFNMPMSAWSRMSPAEQWAANTRFLDRAIARGDNLVLATPAFEAVPNSFFARELEYLMRQGYTLSDDGLRLLAPGP
jgi:hypothetical protein